MSVHSEATSTTPYRPVTYTEAELAAIAEEPPTPYLSPYSPQQGNAFTRWLGGVGLKLIGWELVGRMPDVPKFVILGVPHTSNWDAVAASLAKLKAGFRYTFFIKKEWFFWPMGPIFRWLGGYPVDRGKATGVVAQMVKYIHDTPKVVVGVPPEGTRGFVPTYKKGYLRIAYGAGVPVFICAFDGPNKRVVLDRLMELTGDIEADNAAIRDYVNTHWIGVNPENQFADGTPPPALVARTKAVAPPGSLAGGASPARQIDMS